MKEKLPGLYQAEFLKENSDASFPKLLVLESKADGEIRRTTIFIGSDIDGTINEEHFPESQRINSDAVTSAKDAFKEYEHRGIPIWLISSRTYKEVAMYKERLHAHGGAIFEDGLGIEIPQGSEISKLPQVVKGTYHIVEHNGHSVIVLTRKDSLDKIQTAMQQVEAKTNGSLVNSFIYDASGQFDISKLQALRFAAGHATDSEALKSTVRFASAYVARPTEKQRETLKNIVASYGDLRLRDHGNIIEVYSGHAHKGTALRLILTNPQFFFLDKHLNSVFPIVFGNKENDIEMMQEAILAGGFGVLAAGPLENQYWINEASVPQEVIKATKVAGHGIKEVTPRVLNKIEQTFGIRFPNR